MDKPTSAKKLATEGPDMPRAGEDLPTGQEARLAEGAGADEWRGEAEAQAVPLDEQKAEGGVHPGGGNTPGGALNTGPDAGGRGIGTTE